MNQRKSLAYLSLLGGIVALSLSPLFLRWSEAPGLVTSFYRMTVAALVLTPIGLRACRGQRKVASLPWQALIPGLIAGIFTACDHSFWSLSLSYTSVANAMLFNYIAPLWVALFAALIWKEKLRLAFWAGLILVLGGMALVITSGMRGSRQFNPGDLLAIASSIFYAGYFLAAQRGRERLPTLTFIWLVAAAGSLGTFTAARALGFPLRGFPPLTWLIFLITGLVSQIGGYFMVSYALGNLPAAVVAPSMLASPLLSALLAIPFAGEGLSLFQAAGGLIALTGIWLINRPRAKEELPSAAPNAP